MRAWRNSATRPAAPRVAVGHRVISTVTISPGEALPSQWPVAGTTGYEFIHTAGTLFMHPDGEAPFIEIDQLDLIRR